LRLKIPVIRFFISGLMLIGLTVLPATVAASATLVVTPSTNLTSGQKVTVSATGLKDNSPGAIVECNGDPNQPTVMVEGSAAPVSCTNPLNSILTTSKSGVLTATTYAIKTGILGPPATGTDSNHKSAATDAANYPCPPTAAQLAAGYFCTLSFGDAAGDQLSQNISFAAATKTTTPVTSTTTTTPSSTTQTLPGSVTSLVDTGPGNVIGLFVAIVAIATTAYYTYFWYRNKVTK